MGPKISSPMLAYVGLVVSMSVGCTKKPTESSHPPPAGIPASGDACAASMYRLHRSNASRWITAVMKFEKSAGSPMRIDSIWPIRSSRISAQRLLGTYARETAEHFWPWNSNAPRTRAATRLLGSADVWATTKSLPPVSPTMRG
jgi:hypothetical protein